MNKTLKSIIAGALGTATILSTASAAGLKETSTLVVNGNDTGAKLYIEDDNTVMLPLRALCEELGFEVIWQEEAKRIELVKMPIYITCTPFEDGYTFSRTAPMMLGTAPKLINDRTYVPINFIDEILKGTYETRDDDLYISYGEEAKLKEVAIIETGENTLTVEDSSIGEVILNITENTVIEDEEGNALKFEDITTEDVILVEYDEAMTLSLPAQTNAIKIVKTVKAEEIQPKEVLFVEKTENTLTVYDFEIGNVILNISEETVIEDEEGKALKFEDITSENKILVEYSPAMTMSLPPITNAVKIVKTAETANEFMSGIVEELVFEEDKLTQIIISSEENKEDLTALNVAEETYVLNLDGEEADLTKLEKGDKISGIVSSMTTRSIPPQKAAFKIRIEK